MEAAIAAAILAFVIYVATVAGRKMKAAYREIRRKRERIKETAAIKGESREGQPDYTIYGNIGREVKEEDMSLPVWTKAYSEANGDKEKAKAIYIRLRYEQLKSHDGEQS